MPTQQGSTALLDDPVAQQLLQSTMPARVAYTWSDGTPRVIPIWFHWNGSEIVLGTPVDAPKMKVLHDGARVAVSIDGDTMPYKALLLRGAIHIDTVDGLTPEYVESSKRVLGETDGQAWVENAGPLFPRMSRIFIRPDWVGIIDFETRMPSAVERAMERLQAPA